MCKSYIRLKKTDHHFRSRLSFSVVVKGRRAMAVEVISHVVFLFLFPFVWVILFFWVENTRKICKQAQLGVPHSRIQVELD